MYFGNLFVKGIDYIQSSTIDFRLQKFININYTFLNINESKVNKLIILNDVYMLLIIHDHLYDKSRVIKKIPFNEYDKNNKCGSSNIFTNYSQIINKLQCLSKSIKKLYKIGNKILILNYKNEKLNDAGNLQTYFKLSIYKIELININNNDTIYLYYMLVDICAFTGNLFYIDDEFNTEKNKYNDLSEIENKKCIYRNFHVPIFLTTPDAKITKFGTFSKYIPAGDYVCKFMDYTNQCSYEEGKNRCNKKYSFIAKRYKDIYPLSDLSN